MRISSLYLKNIGPFKESNLNFIDSNNGDNLTNPPIIIFTGINGAGKSIIIDSIRVLLIGEGPGKRINRDIVSNEKDFKIKATLAFSLRGTFNLIESQGMSGRNIQTNSRLSLHLMTARTLPEHDSKWILDYWNSNITTDDFKIKNLNSITPETYLQDALTGNYKNIELTNIISYFDYLQSGTNKEENELGGYLIEKIKKIINLSILNGEFDYVSRSKLTPYVKISGRSIELSKISSGNLYLIQRLLSLLSKAYSVFLLYGGPIKDICKVPGLLLIDEIENHFHPEWQKRLINIILEIFPNLQIILTTHSPFIISSTNKSKVFVCNSHGDYSTISDETENYTNKPIEEILTTSVFQTEPFNKEISDLLEERRNSIQNNDKTTTERIEKKLLELNPEYFRYLKIDKISL